MPFFLAFRVNTKQLFRRNQTCIQHPKKDIRLWNTAAAETAGLLLPKVSLGLWHNFGDTANFENMKKLCFTAFDNGITQFDLANNYGPLPGSAEKNFGRILKEDLGTYRDELIITTKAGYDMWEGPYGN